MGRQNERTGPLGCGRLGGLFLSVGRGNLGTILRLPEGFAPLLLRYRFSKSQ